jgi:hypothetical protein
MRYSKLTGDQNIVLAQFKSASPLESCECGTANEREALWYCELAEGNDDPETQFSDDDRLAQAGSRSTKKKPRCITNSPRISSRWRLSILSGLPWRRPRRPSESSGGNETRRWVIDWKAQFSHAVWLRFELFTLDRTWIDEKGNQISDDLCALWTWLDPVRISVKLFGRRLRRDWR